MVTEPIDRNKNSRVANTLQFKELFRLKQIKFNNKLRVIANEVRVWQSLHGRWIIYTYYLSRRDY